MSSEPDTAASNLASPSHANAEEAEPMGSMALPPPLALRQRMQGRDTLESHRASTPLELLFDLTAVVAVAAAASRLHHGLTSSDIGEATLSFAQSFFAIWWPWMSYTWFASAYDTDDLPFRFATLIQMIGVLLIAAGIPQAVDGGVAGGVGFFLMRAVLVAQWWRASLEHPERRSTCRRYAVAIALIQMLWIARAILLPAEWMFPTFCVLVALELAVPVWAARVGETPWHPHHVAERYGLFTIILLGECMMAAANALAGVLATQGWSLDLAAVALGVVGLIMGLWWAYFLVPFAQVLHHRRERGFLWGYGHAIVFAALAILGGVLEVVVDALRSSAAQPNVELNAHEHASPVFAICLVAGTVILFLSTLWWLGGWTTRRDARTPIYLAPVVITSISAVAWVAHDLSLPRGLLLLATGPALMLAWITRDRRLRPERFAVR